MSTLESTKKDVMNFLTNTIHNIDGMIEFATTSIKNMISEFSIDNPDKSTLEWGLTHMRASYVELIHDLERLKKTMENKQFAD